MRISSLLDAIELPSHNSIYPLLEAIELFNENQFLEAKDTSVAAGIRTHILLLTPELESGKLDRSAIELFNENQFFIRSYRIVLCLLYYSNKCMAVLILTLESIQIDYPNLAGTDSNWFQPYWNPLILQPGIAHAYCTPQCIPGLINAPIFTCQSKTTDGPVRLTYTTIVIHHFDGRSFQDTSTQRHKYNSHGQDLNPHSNDSAIRIQIQCTKLLSHRTPPTIEGAVHATKPENMTE